MCLVIRQILNQRPYMTGSGASELDTMRETLRFLQIKLVHVRWQDNISLYGIPLVLRSLSNHSNLNICLHFQLFRRSCGRDTFIGVVLRSSVHSHLICGNFYL